MYMCAMHKTYMLHSQCPFNLLINKHMKVIKGAPPFTVLFIFPCEYSGPFFQQVNGQITPSSHDLSGIKDHL
jgi:hypothetical protein